MARDRKDAIIALLKAFETETLIKWWNEYCNSVGNDDNIYSNDEWAVNEMFSNPYEALRASCYGEYKFTDYYFTIDCYGNLVSFGDSDIHSHINFDDMAEYIMENGCYEISDVWKEDLVYDFIGYVYEKTEKKLTEDEVYDMIEDGTDLVTENWDDIIKRITEDEE